jgi:hypothetical protein
MFLVTESPTACMVRYDANCTYWNSSWTIVCHVLPMINISSSDMSCIYSTMEFDGRQARQYQMTLWSVAIFDQLYSDLACFTLKWASLSVWDIWWQELDFMTCLKPWTGICIKCSRSHTDWESRIKSSLSAFSCWHSPEFTVLTSHWDIDDR